MLVLALCTAFHSLSTDVWMYNTANDKREGKLARPVKYKSEMLDIVLDLMSQGASKVEVAAQLGITRDTLYQWVRKYPEFSDTIKMGETYSQAWWERQARLGLGRSSVNTALWFINMKNRFGWHDGLRSSEDRSKEELKVATIVDLGGV